MAERLQVALDFHRSVSDQAVAHLNLLHDTAFRTPWLAAKLLSTDKALAKSSTADLVRHLVTTRPGNMTYFEHHMFTHGEVWENLKDFSNFSNAEPPVILFGSKGCMRASSNLWLLASVWPLAMSWMQRGSMLDGSGPVLLNRAMKIMALSANIAPPALLREQPDLPLTRGLLATLAC